ncbi:MULTISPECIES: pirin family protein [unclassified Streptomyces]|uniref:pirin family protein n=1 Tax=unclassified Streptomyces TaxID=2593676 RepID=UPI00224CC0D9|nr:MULTISPECIES: pirin family protein [unclassified Streptomyces]WSP59340.1 pirin family protein [Streptomyces sp. NBC_01241]WSU20140.1 pirin family protein [Streptomyces sp. NBC_01108]MCX4791095.1 pirin family protein [Streptomyces sp. NBC_01221]MCX4793180.1 pirin family protein [Streptomyces sp. NBC_01242]WSJ34626.1 pirin family protein [Streptomyces sp. NBC_01321]
MSNLDRQAALSVCGGRGFVVAEPVRELLTPRRVQLGESTEVRRLLPNLGRRMVGAWAFVDHYGPDDIAGEPGMQVPPHPHMGLQTVSWLHDGEVLHRDSLGSLRTIRPRELGLMTSGRAISHSEESPKSHARFLHGAQLWVALPEAHRHVEPHFQHHTELPTVTAAGLAATLILGELDGATSPGTAYTPIVGADLSLSADAEARLPLDPDFEYAVLSMSGQAEVDGVPMLPGSMLYLGCGRTELPLRADTDAGLMLLGGEPFEEEIVMWWNFIGRSHEDIAQARADWADGARFGEVYGYDGGRLPAPELPPVALKPRGRVR